MDYSEEYARELLSKHQLSESAIKQWRRRGKIPDKYDPARDPATEKLVKRVLALNWVNIRGFARLSGIEENRLHYAVKQDKRLNPSEVATLLEHIKNMSLPMQYFMDMREGKENSPLSEDELALMWAIATSDYIKLETAFDEADDHTLFFYFKNKPYTVSEEVISKFQEKLKALLKQVKVKKY